MIPFTAVDGRSRNCRCVQRLVIMIVSPAITGRGRLMQRSEVSNRCA
ncbi:MAG: hypothetical protein IPG96_00170 [Proteobacteria bacterium]|nr:hypothetical protein [Pseudomonadota bacterium]